MPKPGMPVAKPFAPYWETPGGLVRLYKGDSLDVLRKLPSKSVQTVVTSPPYWGLRDYGTGEWQGGDPNCSHKVETVSDKSRLVSPHNPVAGWTTRDATVRLNSNHKSTPVHKEGFKSPFRGTATGGSSYLEQGKMTSGGLASRSCPLGCGASCVDHQLGSESIPDCGQKIKVEPGLFRLGNCAEENWETGCHVCRMVLVFREVRRVLRDDGTLWLNYGDSYGAASGRSDKDREIRRSDGTSGKPTQKHNGDRGSNYTGLKSGNLVGIPWRVALALQADGWVLRQDIIWNKPSPMPESVRNRCTKAHEYVFLLTKKGSGYYCDMEAIRESGNPSSEAWYNSSFDNATEKGQERAYTKDGNVNRMNPYNDGKREFSGDRNKRSVWTVSSQGYDGAHFATFPPKLIEPMIKAGTSEKGCCAKCGAPWVRVTDVSKLTRERPNDYVKRTGEEGTGNSCANSVAGVSVKTVGWEPSCECFGKFETRKGVRLGYGSYHAHEKDGIEHGMYQDGKGPSWPLPEPTKEFETTVREYVSDIPLEEHPVIPCTVLDLFIGSGTTCCVSIGLGRRSIGIDLSRAYLDNNAIPRIEGEILSRPALSGLIAREIEEGETGDELNW